MHLKMNVVLHVSSLVAIDTHMQYNGEILQHVAPQKLDGLLCVLIYIYVVAKATC